MVVLLAAALFAAAPAQVAEANVLKGTLDVLLVRPFRVVMTGIGVGLGLPMSLLALGDSPEASKRILRSFIVEPAKSIYQPKIGDWQYASY